MTATDFLVAVVLLSGAFVLALVGEWSVRTLRSRWRIWRGGSELRAVIRAKDREQIAWRKEW